MPRPITAEIPRVGTPVPAISDRMVPLEHATVIDVAEVRFESFYRSSRDRIGRALAVTTGDADLAAEAVDEAMIRAYQRWSRVSTLDNPAAWVYRVGLNYCHSRFRRLTRKFAHQQRQQADATHVDLPFSDSIADRELARALQRLSIDQRAVVVCRVILELSEHETAAALNIRNGTVKSRLSRGLGILRTELGVAAPPPSLTVHHAPKEDPS